MLDVRHRIASCALLTLLVTALAPLPADAMTVKVEATTFSLSADGGTIDADVVATTDGGAWQYRVTSSAPITVGQWCTLDAGSTTAATCTGWSVDHASVTGGDGADRLVVSGPLTMNRRDSTIIDLAGGDDQVDLSAMEAWTPKVRLGAGNDTITSCAGCNPDGGDGWDTIAWSESLGSYASDDFEQFRGSSGRDVYRDHALRYDMGEGDDVVRAPASTQHQRIDLGPGDDRYEMDRSRTVRMLFGGTGSDTIIASSTKRAPAYVCLDPRLWVCGRYNGFKGTRTRIRGGFENARVSGLGRDVLVGNASDNRLEAGGGDDYLAGGNGRDTFVGGDGVDIVSYQYPFLQRGGIRVRHDGRRNDGSRGEDLISRDVEIIIGSAYNDVLETRLSGTGLFGFRGNDRLIGGYFPDYLDGGPGNDVIRARGGRGVDVVKCGPGRDTVFADRRDDVARDCERVRRG